MTEPPSYFDGTEIKVGDQVVFSGGHCGIVTLLIGRPEAGAGIVSSEWDYLGDGILLSTKFGIMYYDSDQLDMLEFRSRK